jgi:hypothetical protein
MPIGIIQGKNKNINKQERNINESYNKLNKK